MRAYSNILKITLFFALFFSPLIYAEESAHGHGHGIIKPPPPPPEPKDPTPKGNTTNTTK